MTGILITGDRSMHPVLAVNLVAQALAVLPEGTEIATGTLGGVEAAVRYLLPGVAAHWQVVGGEVTDETLDHRHQAMRADGVERVIFLHADPFESRIFKSVLRVWPEDEAVSFLV